VTLPEPQELEGTDVLAALGIRFLFGISAGFVLGLIPLIGTRPFVDQPCGPMTALGAGPLRRGDA